MPAARPPGACRKGIAAITDIQIEYCVACGFLSRAEEIQHALLTDLGQQVDGVRLKPGRGGRHRAVRPRSWNVRANVTAGEPETDRIGFSVLDTELATEREEPPNIRRC